MNRQQTSLQSETAENFSHANNDYSKTAVQKRSLEIKNRLKEETAKSGFTFEVLSKMVDELAAFPLGEFLIMNQGLNGYWTDYAINYPRDRITELPSLEQAILTSRAFTSTYQRQQIFKAENQKELENGKHLAVIPAGLMSEVFDLDYSQIENIQITGIDLDDTAFTHAQNKYPKMYKKYTINNECKNALAIDYIEKFDLISSNGLTIYIEDNKLVQELFTKFYQALKNGGKLVTSFLTYPLIFGAKSEQKPRYDTEKQKLEIAVFTDILQVQWSAFRTTNEMKELLTNSGFTNTEIIADENYVFPTIIAHKN